MGKWLLLSILYTVSTLTLFQGPWPAFCMATESWARFSGNKVSEFCTTNMSALSSIHYWPLWQSDITICNSRLSTVDPIWSLTWKAIMIGGIISENWVHEPASSHIDERWLCRQGKTTDRSACKDKTTSYINTFIYSYIQLKSCLMTT